MQPDDLLCGWHTDGSLDAPLLEAVEQYLHSLTTANTAAAEVAEAQGDSSAMHNWAGNVRYRGQVHMPPTVSDLQALVRRSAKLRVLGTRHSFSLVADANLNGDLVVPMPAISAAGYIAIDAEARTVSCSAGTTYAVLAERLHKQGWALHNMASLPHISVMGALATATHGSGHHLGNLTTALTTCRFVNAKGALVRASDATTLQAVLLGALGVVTEVTLRIQPAYAVRQDVYLHVPWERLEERASLDEIFRHAYSVSVFVDDWSSPTGASQAWFKHRVPTTRSHLPPAPAHLFGALRAGRKMHPIASERPDACTEQGVAGPWHERLPHFHAQGEPSSRGDELQSEYFVARADAPAAIKALRRIGALLRDVLQVSELRVVAADELWLSPSYGRDSMGIHFTWKHDVARVTTEALPLVETALRPFDARPHWGKLFGISPARIATLYPKLREYRALIQRLDPGGKFLNDFVRRYVLAVHITDVCTCCPCSERHEHIMEVRGAA